MSNEQRINTIIQSSQQLSVFFNEIFSQSNSLFPHGFKGGQYVTDVANFLQYNKRTAKVGPREHLKSTSLYGHFMQKLLTCWDQNIEGHYFSFQYQMAAYHIAKIKKAVASNPFFDGIIDKKKNAESVICYTWDNEHFITLEPHGLLEFKRGIHAPLIYVDDPFQDPGNKMVVTIIKKVNDIIRGQVLDMVQDEIHIRGTPQTNEDFFFDKDIMSRFATEITPAIKDEINKIVLWPEWMSFEELMARKKEKGEKLFNQEYQCSPTHAEEAFLKHDVLMALVNPLLENHNGLIPLKYYDKDKEGKQIEIKPDVVGGHDLGKKAHPAHFTAFKIIKGKRIQICSKWFDGVDYKDQLAWIKNAITNLQIDKVYYDNTRGEFEGFAESGQVPDEMVPVVFSSKEKNSMATLLDAAVSDKNIEFINHKRTLDQMLLVTNDLDAIATPEGHGDSFWSTAMTFKHEASQQEQPQIFILE